MKRFSLSFFGDILAVILISFSISIVIFTYFLQRPLNLIYSALLTIISSAILIKILVNKRKIKGIANKNQKHCLEVLEQLNFQGNPKNNELFFNAIRKAEKDAVLKKDGVFLPSKNALIVTRFSFDDVTKTDIIKIFNLIKRGEKVVILAQSFTPQVQDFVKRFDDAILLYDGQKAYEILKKYECLPPLNFNLKNTPKKVFSAKNLFVKKKAKTFLGFGLSFLFFSFFVPLKTYYIVCGTIMLVYSVICILFGIEPEKNSAI